jgi:5-methylcytosine-specific restriction endonuclease McrA
VTRIVRVLVHTTLETIEVALSVLVWGVPLPLNQPTLATGQTRQHPRTGDVPYLRLVPADKFCVRVTHIGEDEERKGEGWITTLKQALLSHQEGTTCFYCARSIPLGLQELEHLIPLSAGGPDRAENMVLACKGCNRKVKDWSLKKKIEYRDEIRGQGHSIKEHDNVVHMGR